MVKAKVSPVKKIKEGAKGTYYEAEVGCTKLSIIIMDDEDGSPCRITVQPNKTRGGCQANIEALQRVITLFLECNIKEDILIEQLDQVVCGSCKSQMIRGDKTIALSCAKAIGAALKKHINGGGK